MPADKLRMRYSNIACIHDYSPATQLPRPPHLPLVANSYFLCPLSWFPGNGLLYQATVVQLYMLAMAHAQAVVRPSLMERDLLGVWN